jgi:hypothetical protein
MISVVDTLPPTIVCPPDVSFIRVIGDAGMATATDDCDPAPNVSFTDNVIQVGACPLDEIIERTWIAVDACGNASSCVQIITIEFPSGGMISDFVWQDVNGDGIQDPGEPGLPNVDVYLFDDCAGGGGGALLAQTTTNGSGLYEFANLCAGTYLVFFDGSSLPSGYTETLPNQGGDDGADSDCIDGFVCVVLATDDSVDRTIDCGFIPPDVERAHPGWNSVDNLITLTHNEPTYWSALTGQPKGVSSFTILDPSGDPLAQGRPALDGTTDRVLRGSIYAWAVDAEENEIAWNHLQGSGTVVNYGNGSAWEYNAWAFQVVAPVMHGGLALPPFGRLDLDGVEYTPGFNQLLLDFQAAGSNGFSGGAFPNVLTQTDLTLHPIGVDLRQENHGPITTKATFVVWNENETQFTGLHRCITCWDQTLLSLYSEASNHFLVGNLQTDKGKARIDGVASTICSSNCCIARPMGAGNTAGCASSDCQALVCAVNSFCCTMEWNDECVWIAVDLCQECDGVNEDAPMLGVASKHIEFNGAARAAGGLNLIGLGTEPAAVLHDRGGVAPPPVQAPGTLVDDLFDAAFGGAGEPVTRSETPGVLGSDHGADDRSPTTAAAANPPASNADRVSGSEKGSLLLFSNVEIRWDAAGNIVQDTFIHIANDWPQDVQVKMYFINGDPPLAEQETLP